MSLKQEDSSVKVFLTSFLRVQDVKDKVLVLEELDLDAGVDEEIKFRRSL